MADKAKVDRVAPIEAGSTFLYCSALGTRRIKNFIFQFFCNSYFLSIMWASNTEEAAIQRIHFRDG